MAGSSRKVKGTLHWVSAPHAVKATVRLYNHLFQSENPGEGELGYQADINPDSLEVLDSCWLEPSLELATLENRYQFLRQGYFALDPVESGPGSLVFNRIVSLRDSWARAQKSGA